jgi:hypothetical protein
MKRVGREKKKIVVHLPEKILPLFTTTVPNFGKILADLFLLPTSSPHLEFVPPVQFLIHIGLLRRDRKERIHVGDIFC